MVDERSLPPSVLDLQHLRSAASLAKAIFKADVPENVVRSLPSQTIFLAIKALGLESSNELLEMLSKDQYRDCLDLEFWEGDRFNEELFFSWLALTDESEDRAPLQAFLTSIDLKLLGVLINRYVDVLVFEERADAPPAAHYYTPDNGHTWITINIDDAERHRLFAKMLAYIFQTNSEVFYQLISLPTVSTASELEEEAYQERSKRVLDLGLPDSESAARVNAPLPPNEKISAPAAAPEIVIPQGIAPIEPIIYNAQALEPLRSLFRAVTQLGSIGDIENFEIEITWVMNCALVHFKVPLANSELVMRYLERVRGAINIGLEERIGSAGNPQAAFDLYRSTGIERMYRAGLSHIFSLRREARRVPEEAIKSIAADRALLSILAHAREEFPDLPAFFESSGEWRTENAALVEGERAFDHLEEVAAVGKILRERLVN